MDDIKLKPTRIVNQIRATSSLASLHSLAESEDSPICWICLDGAASDKPLYKPCKCPRYCHSSCIARWQLQSAGSRKETHCEFCQETLPDWKQVLTPSCGANAPAVMNVNFDGRTYSFEVTPGENGYKLFTEAIRNAFNLPEDSELNITFTCDEPSTEAAESANCCNLAAGALLTLQGAGAYDAAVHCASVSAARRMASQPSSTASEGSRLQSQGSSSSASSASSTSERRILEQQLSNSSLFNGKPRRMAAIGRKLRTALCDLLAMK